tara:strand:+ start:29054 stop:29686 length:633 start_codon:yes stop_codon:yes gene_type:complete
MNNYIEALKWRYATKKFDTSKKVAAEDLNILKEAMQLSASSYGLQPYKIFVIEDQEIRKQLQPAAYGQSQIVDASHLIVIANKADFDENLVDSYVDEISKVRGIEPAQLSGMADYMKKNVVDLAAEMKAQWTAKQTYIVLGNLLAAAAQLKIDTCPMEGFDAKKFNKILGLANNDYNASVIVALGYRSADDATQHLPKVRRPQEVLFETI